MYLNTKKEDTNIDDQFNKAESKEFDISKYKMPLIIGGIILLIIIIIIIIAVSKNKNRYYIELFGPENISMYKGSNYVEIGYKGYDKKKNDLTAKVKVDNKIDINKLGEYQVIYKLENTVVKRFVTVIEPGKETTNIYLKGKDSMTLLVGDEYQEPGYIAIDTIDGNITDKVKVNSNLNTSKPGIYEITYNVVNSKNINTTIKRTISVQENNMKNLPTEK